MRRKLLNGKIATLIAILLVCFALPQWISAQEAYVVADGTTLTFYYDTQRATHIGKTVYGINDKHPEASEYPAWAGYDKGNVISNKTTTRVLFDDSFSSYRPQSTRNWFYQCTALQSIEGMKNLNTSEVIDMSQMFSDCSSLTSLDLSHFKTDKVTDMSSMFSSCKSLTSLDVTQFNTAQASNLKGMFAYCEGLTSLDLSLFNTDKVTDMGYMFEDCASLTTLDLSNFNTEKVTNMYGMFASCFELTSLDVTNFKTDKVSDMRFMFYSCETLTTIYCNNSWCAKMSVNMFSGCEQLQGAVPYDPNKTDVSMANPDTGYFTRKGVVAKEAYVVEDGAILTFYYDTMRATHTGKTVYGINDKHPEASEYPAWAGYYKAGIKPNKTTTKVVFDNSFADYRPTTMKNWFYACSVLKHLEGIEYLNSSDVTDMSFMFYRCYQLKSLDATHFITDKVTNMSSMFYYCSELKSLDLTTFNTAQVTSMYSMFSNCPGLTSLDLTNFDTSKVTFMSFMFFNCENLTTIYCNDSWSVEESMRMFLGCTQLQGAVSYDPNKTDASMANPDTGYFTKKGDIVAKEAYVVEDGATLTFYYDTMRATHAGKTVYGINDKHTENPECPIWAGYKKDDKTNTKTEKVVFDSSFATYRPTTTKNWFFACKALTQLEGMEYLNTSEVTDMSGMFADCQVLTSLDLSHFNTDKVTNMSYMFDGCWALTSLDVTPFNTAQVTDMSGMFWECTELTSLDVTHFNTSRVTSMRTMFASCLRLTTLDVTSFNTEHVTNMSSMFSDCGELTSLDVSHFNTAQVTDMKGMFSACAKLTALDLTHFNTSKVTDMYGMFAFCSSLTTLDLTHFNIDKVTDMSFMFYPCKKLTTIYCNDTWSTDKSKNMFLDCELLKGAVPYDKAKVDVSMANPDTGYFTKKINDGLDFVTDTPHKTVIYDLQGIRQIDDFNSLPAGIYIVNGKKMIRE